MAKVKVYSNITAKDASNVIMRSLAKGDIVIILANCVIHYEGRALSDIGPGDRLVIIKPDGTLIIHKKIKREPVNWQPPGSKVHTHEKDGRLIIRSVRHSPYEIIIVECLDLYLIVTYDAIDPYALEISGTERDLAEMIYRNPNVIEDGFKVLKLEYQTPFGIIDILGEDKDGKLVVIELKRATAGLQSVSQLRRYVEAMKNMTKKDIRGILIAPRITESALALVRKYGLEYKKLEPPKIPKHMMGSGSRVKSFLTSLRILGAKMFNIR